MFTSGGDSHEIVAEALGTWSADGNAGTSYGASKYFHGQSICNSSLLDI
jgi:hypothetical protein